MRLIEKDGLSPGWYAIATMWRGWALAETGKSQQGIAAMRLAIDGLSAAGFALWLPQFLATLAEAYRQVGRLEDALAAIGESLKLVEQTGESWFLAEIYRLQGDLLLAQDSTSPDASVQAEACFSKAIAIARQQAAKLFELRATTSLARMRLKRGMQPEASQALAEIYGWFTEGFDTKDLREAKALLHTLQ